MRVVLLTATMVGRERLKAGEEIETTDYSGAKMIRRGWAKAASKPKPKPKPKAKKELAAEE